MTHGDLVNSCLLYLAKHGTFWSNATGAIKTDDRFIRYGLSGSSDIIGCCKGRFVGVECKVGRDSQRKNQAAFEKAITKSGGIYILARSIDDISERLSKEGLL